MSVFIYAFIVKMRENQCFRTKFLMRAAVNHGLYLRYKKYEKIPVFFRLRMVSDSVKQQTSRGVDRQFFKILPGKFMSRNGGSREHRDPGFFESGS